MSNNILVPASEELFLSKYVTFHLALLKPAQALMPISVKSLLSQPSVLR